MFDFDDTIVKTNSKVIVTHGSGEITQMDPGEYATYDALDDDEFDYSEFQDLGNNSERVEEVTEFFLNRFVPYLKDGKNIVILTARKTKQPMIDFFYEYLIKYPQRYNFTREQLRTIIFVPLGDSDPNAKRDWISDKIKNSKLDKVEFYDDSQKNIDAVDELKDEFPGVLKTKRITY